MTDTRIAEWRELLYTETNRMEKLALFGARRAAQDMFELAVTLTNHTGKLDACIDELHETITLKVHENEHLHETIAGLQKARAKRSHHKMEGR